MYRVITKQGVTYRVVRSWKHWNMNVDFLEFTWDGGKIFIIPIASIESIEEL